MLISIPLFMIIHVLSFFFNIFFSSIALYNGYDIKNIIPPSESESRDDIVVPGSVLVAAAIGPVAEWFE